MAPQNLTIQNRFIYALLGVGFLFFTGLVYTEAVPAHAPGYDQQALEGKALWQKHNCSSCHQLYGLGGYLGPDLTNTISDKNKGRAFAAAIMKNGTQVMPDFKLNDKEIEALLAFLDQTDKSGSNIVHDYQVGLDGTITSKATEQK